MYKVGDRVYVNNLGSTLYKKPATIDIAINGIYHLRVDGGITAGGYSDVDLSPLMRFNVGDLVQTVSDGVGQTKTVKGDTGLILQVLSNCYQVEMDKLGPNGISTYLFDDSHIELSNQNYTSSLTIGSSTKWGYSPITTMNKVGDAMSSTCNHKWKDYIGLSKRMDICELCPATKNERGIYD